MKLIYIDADSTSPSIWCIMIYYGRLVRVVVVVSKRFKTNINNLIFM